MIHHEIRETGLGSEQLGDPQGKTIATYEARFTGHSLREMSIR